MPMLLPLVALLAAAPGPASPATPVAAPVALSPTEIVAAASAGEWIDIAASDLLVMELAPDRDGAPRRVEIQLIPPPFSQGWVGNIRKLAAARWWNGTSINRVQDNYVVQWGDASEKKPVPPGLATVPQSEYEVSTPAEYLADVLNGVADRAGGPPRPSVNATFPSDRDAYATTVGFFAGFPVGEMKRGHRSTLSPLHCYGMVGVGRNMPPDTGTGAELYTVIGQAPRQLDRNIALVGRVVSGIEHLTSLPRGTGALGFYEKPEQRVPIVSVRLASDMPEAERPHLQFLSTDSSSFARYADARANRRDQFYLQPAGGVDICNVPVPVRQRP